jgi:hypothetical protein
MLKQGWRTLHRAFIVIFIAQMMYGYYMVFFVGGNPLPLFGQATEMGAEDLVLRRLYSIETWLAIGGLALYLALTEVLPRRIAALLDERASRHGADVPGDEA